MEQMVDTVKTVTLQASPPKVNVREKVPASSVAPVAAASDDAGFVSSSIRVDNLQNVAILEYRSAEGEVLQQYPSQQQIEAFQRARALERRVAEAAEATPAPAQQETTIVAADSAPVAEAAPAAADTSTTSVIV